MGIKIGDISPLAGAITGEGMFGGIRAMSPVMMAIDAIKDKKKERAAATAAEEVKAAEAEAQKKPGMKRGGAVKKMANGGSTASKRADGCATKGKTKGRFV